MKKRMFVMLILVAVIVATIGGIKYFQISKAMAAQGSFQQPPEAVTTILAKQELWDTTLNGIGTVAAVQGVTVSADLPGVVEFISFESGERASKGDILVRLDTKQEEAQLAAAQAQLDLTRLDLERKQGLVAKQAVAQAVYERVAAEHKQAQARLAEIRATIDRKTIRAPFSGTLGIRQVNVGQFVGAGAPIVSLQSIQPAFVNFTVPQQEVGRVPIGSTVTVTADGMEQAETGRVAAIDSVVDEATRNVQVQAIFANERSRLRPGMFVEARLARGGAKTPVITLPASAISYAPFGDSVFIVEDVAGPDGKKYRGVRQQFVKLGQARGDLVAVLSGLKPGEEVVTSGVFKLRPGAAVTVNNSVKPGSSANPRPEDS
jgi:membrane fusion protein (multidrug efflux system)